MIVSQRDFGKNRSRNIVTYCMLLIFALSCTHKSDSKTIAEIPLTHRLRNLETRQFSELNPRDFIINLKEKGYNVLTTGAIYGTGYSLIENDIFPLHPKANPEWLPNVIEEAHKKNAKVNLWVVFNIQDVRKKEQYIIDDLFPESEIKFIGDNNSNLLSKDQTGMCMLSSPYKQKHTDFIKEVAKLGSDGIWFDGFYLMGMPGRGIPGCICNFCEEKFQNDTGLQLPKQINWNDLAFKKWVRWRNQQLVKSAEQLTNEIHKINSTCKVAFNTNSWPFMSKDWINGVPLWHTNKFGVSQHAFINIPQQRWLMMGFKSKLSHDLNPNQSDIWQYSAKQFNTGNLEKDKEMSRIYTALHNYAGITYGTTPWKAAENPKDAEHHNKDLAPLEKWFQTKQLKNIGVYISQNTHDFWGHKPNTNNLDTYRNSVLGTWQMLTEKHFQFEFFFDNQINIKKLSEYKTVILPNVVCLSDTQKKELIVYAKSGGNLIITDNTGTFDEWAENRINNADLKAVSSYYQADPGKLYLKDKKNEVSNQLVAELRKLDKSFVQIKAPNYIASNTFKDKEGKLYIHLLNVRSLYQDSINSGFVGLEDKEKAKENRYNPYQKVKAKIELTFNHDIEKDYIAYPTNSNIKKVSGNKISISQMGLHEMILINPKKLTK